MWARLRKGSSANWCVLALEAWIRRVCYWGPLVFAFESNSARSAATVSFEDASHKRTGLRPAHSPRCSHRGRTPQKTPTPPNGQRVRSSRPVPISHSLIERSQLAVARVRPSGDTAMNETRAMWPWSCRASARVLTSHRSILPDVLPVANRSPGRPSSPCRPPARNKREPYFVPAGPCQRPISSQVEVSHNQTVPLCPAAARSLPSAEKATADTCVGVANDRCSLRWGMSLHAPDNSQAVR